MPSPASSAFPLFRKAQPSDLPALMQVFASARRYMKATGNPTQWGDSYPSESLVAGDIASGYCHVLESVNGEVVGTFCLVKGDDPTYSQIQGAWLNSAPYATLHRLASSGKVRGIADACLQWCCRHTDNLRIDTHADNRVMQAWLDRRGFIFCGIIRVADGTPRRAYQLFIKSK